MEKVWQGMSSALGVEELNVNLTLPLLGCVTLGKFLTIPEEVSLT